MPATTPLLSHRYLRSYFQAPDHLGNRLVGGGEGIDSFVVRGAGWWGVGFCFLGGGWGEGGCVCEKEGRWLGWGGDVTWGSDGVSEGLGGCEGRCLCIMVWICTGGWGSLEGLFLGDAMWAGCVLSRGASFVFLNRFFLEGISWCFWTGPILRRWWKRCDCF